MKLSSFVLSALAFGMSLSGVAATHGTVTVVAEGWTNNPGLDSTVNEEVDAIKAGAKDIVTDAVNGGARRGRELQKTATVIMCEGGTAAPADIINNVDFCVNYSYDSVEVTKTEVDCATVTFNPEPDDVCFHYTISYIAVFDAEGETVDTVEFSSTLDAITDTIKSWIEDVILATTFNAKAVTAGATFDEFTVEGDPHFKTWGGKWFDFMGECDLKMVHAPHFDGEDKPLDVDVRTKIRYDYSYVESAAVKLGNDTLEVASFGDYFLNGVEGAAMPAFVGGYPVTHSNPSKKVHVFEIKLAVDEKITIKTFKDLVAVSFDGANMDRLRGALGMSGSYDKFGKMIGRDGQTEIEDPTAFANEWQIRQDETSLFHVAKGPQHPEQCKLPKISTSDNRRRLGEGLAREKAERACAHFSGEQFENCVFDVMAVGDIEIAQAGAY